MQCLRPSPCLKSCGQCSSMRCRTPDCVTAAKRGMTLLIPALICREWSERGWSQEEASINVRCVCVCVYVCVCAGWSRADLQRVKWAWVKSRRGVKICKMCVWCTVCVRFGPVLICREWIERWWSQEEASINVRCVCVCVCVCLWVLVPRWSAESEVSVGEVK